jgi:hypothetical protein
MTIKTIPILPEAPAKGNPMDTICEFKWNYPIFQVDRGEFRSCCRTPSAPVSEELLQEKGIDAFLNNDKLIQSRLDLIQGIRHSDCQSCWNLEDRGMKSPREPENFWNFLKRERVIPKDMEYNEENVRVELGKINSPDHQFLKASKPYMMEISLGNTCDLKCMYCNHHYSTQWATELIKIGEITQEQYDREFPKASSSYEEKFWEWFDHVGRWSIHRINMIGGEPLIIPEFYEYVERMMTQLNVIKTLKNLKPTLCIVTNLHTPANYFNRFIDRLPKITEVFDLEILISMESLENRAEYIRNGIGWNKFNSNVHKLLAVKDANFQVGFLMSVNVLSIPTTKNFVEYATNLSDQYQRPIGLKQNIVNFPKWQNPMILPPEFSKYLYDTIKYMEQHVARIPNPTDFHGRYDQYMIFLRSLAESLANNTGDYTEDRKKFYHWYADFDKRRNINLMETFPELKDFYKMCGKL